MKKIFTYMLAGLSLLLFSRCDALDIDPTSSIADSNYWKRPSSALLMWGCTHCLENAALTFSC